MEITELTSEPVVQVLTRKPHKSFTIPEGTVVDWTKSNKQLAAEFGVCILTVFNYRKRNNIASNRRGRPNKKS